MPEPQEALDMSRSSREAYLRDIAAELVRALHNVLGASDAAGFVSLAAQRIAVAHASPPNLARADLPAVLVELKRMLGADFYVVSENADSILLGNRTCPFGRQGTGQPALCMSTSNILGSITARHLGYARIEIQRAILNGDFECLVAIHLSPRAGTGSGSGREYYAATA